jgi:hypothetical protein
MPAQTEEHQLPVPVFRMLGSDPVRQYDQGVSSNGQGVITLEPVYPYGGGDSAWVHWYFTEFEAGTSLEFNYAQTGQENSFTWGAMAKGFTLQMPLIAKLRDERKVKVETLGESAKWFRERYKTTPATSVTISKDLEGSDRKTAWFNSRFYRVNLLWENGRLRIRDIHLFDEDLLSFYTKGVATSNACEFLTLPFVDGYLWSSKDKIAGMQLKAVVDGKDVFLEGADPGFSEPRSGVLGVSWPLLNVAGTLKIEMDEQSLSMNLEGNKEARWHLELVAGDNAKLPFTMIGSRTIDCEFQGMEYSVVCERGTFHKSGANGAFEILPDEGELKLNLAERN